MNITKLKALVDRPETHAKIVGSYQGNYTLGVGANPPALVLRVEGDDLSRFPSAVTIDGETIAIVITGHYVPPEPLAANR